MLLELIRMLVCDQGTKDRLRLIAELETAGKEESAALAMEDESINVQNTMKTLKKVVEGKAKQKAIVVFRNKTRNKGMMLTELNRDHWLEDLKNNGAVVVDFGDCAIAYAA